MATLTTPADLMPAGSLAAAAASVDDCGATVALSPPPDELPPRPDAMPVMRMVDRIAVARAALKFTETLRVVVLGDILPGAGTIIVLAL